MGLLDAAFDDPATMGLLATAAGLLQAGGPSRTPIGFGQAVGGSLLGGMQAMQQGRQAQQENAINQLRMRGLLGDIQDKELARQQALDAQDWYRKYNQGRVAGPQPQPSAMTAPMASAAPGGVNSPKTGGPDWLQAYQASAPTKMQPAQQQMGADSTEKLFRDRMAMADAMRSSGIPALIQKADDIEKSALQFRPKFATEFRQATGADGKLHNYQVAEDGTIREVALGVKPDWKLVDNGGTQQFVDQNSVTNGLTFEKTMTPDAVAVNALGRDRLNFEKSNSDRLQHVVVGDQPMTFNPKTGRYDSGIGPDGKQLPKSEKPLTEAQAKANLFGTRARESDKILDSLAAINDSGPFGLVTNDRPGLIKQSVEGTLGMIPDFLGGAKISSAGGSVVNTLPTWVGGPNSNQQRAEQAQRDFINAVLRRESGAVISPSEFDNARKQYFKQPGDSDAVIAQKALNRKIAIQGMLAEVPGGPRGFTLNSSLPGGWTVSEKP